MAWRDYGFVIASRYRKAVLQALSHRPKAPKEIAVEAGLSLSHVSRALSQLAKKELVVCVNPEAVKGRIYELTPRGQKVRDFLAERLQGAIT